MALRYYYQVDLNGQPIPGTNAALVKRPLVNGKGQKWVEYIPYPKLQPCCEDGMIKVTSLNRKFRFYVRLSGSTNLPISGTLQKRFHKAPTYNWQEVISKQQCATVPLFQAFYRTDGTTPFSINILDLLAPIVGSTAIMVDTGIMDTEDGHYSLDISADGGIDVIDNDAGIFDYIDIRYSIGGCTYMFRLALQEA